MNEIIQNLEVNATNGEENFCYISENKLNSLKELSKREYEELKKKDEVIEKAIDKCGKTLNYINNTLLLNNIKVELTELLKIKGGLDIILESLIEEVE